MTVLRCLAIIVLSACQRTGQADVDAGRAALALVVAPVALPAATWDPVRARLASTVPEAAMPAVMHYLLVGCADRPGELFAAYAQDRDLDEIYTRVHDLAPALSRAAFAEVVSSADYADACRDH